jgi:hypothetical protein
MVIQAQIFCLIMRIYFFYLLGIFMLNPPQNKKTPRSNQLVSEPRLNLLVNDFVSKPLNLEIFILCNGVKLYKNNCRLVFIVHWKIKKNVILISV